MASFGAELNGNKVRPGWFVATSLRPSMSCTYDRSMGLLSKLQAIDDDIRRPEQVRIRDAARQWWAFLFLSAATFVVAPFTSFLLSSDVRFLFLVGPLLSGGFVAFWGGFQLNNHLRASGRSTGGFWRQRVLD